MGLKREPRQPGLGPKQGLVWSAILTQIDRVGAGATSYVSVRDMSRESLHTHPWTMGGGGATDLESFSLDGMRTQFHTRNNLQRNRPGHVP